jgi:hypothetical protein
MADELGHVLIGEVARLFHALHDAVHPFAGVAQ